MASTSGLAYEVHKDVFLEHLENAYLTPKTIQPIFARIANIIYSAPDKMGTGATSISGTIHYYKRLPDLVANTDKCGIPDEFIEYVIKRVLLEIDILLGKRKRKRLASIQAEKEIAEDYIKHFAQSKIGDSTVPTPSGGGDDEEEPIDYTLIAQWVMDNYDGSSEVPNSVSGAPKLYNSAMSVESSDWSPLYGLKDTGGAAGGIDLHSDLCTDNSDYVMMFVVDFDITDTSSTRFIMDTYDSVAGVRTVVYQNDGGGDYQGCKIDGNKYQSSSSFTNKQVLTIVLDNANDGGVYQNKSLITTIPSPAKRKLVTPLKIGTNYQLAQNYLMIGSIAEVRIYRGTMTGTQRESVEDELINTYGI